mmetsp:Transcript_1655/g.3513  ORF Transcript_1655/g.3513 Transcript_1655/m.3513 type:complete len:95 (+) Transcript_1655:125-409(+)
MCKAISFSSATTIQIHDEHFYLPRSKPSLFLHAPAARRCSVDQADDLARPRMPLTPPARRSDMLLSSVLEVREKAPAGTAARRHSLPCGREEKA